MRIELTDLEWEFLTELLKKQTSKKAKTIAEKMTQKKENPRGELKCGDCGTGVYRYTHEDGTLLPWCPKCSKETKNVVPSRG